MLGKCYFTDKIKRNFDDSQAHCKEVFPLGGKLFEPRDETTNKEVLKAYKRYHGEFSNTWLGITDRISQGSYKYESDNGQLTISKWSEGQPNYDSERCVISLNSSGAWNDYPCSGYNFLHICESTY